jgi:hypothetical protein
MRKTERSKAFVTFADEPMADRQAGAEGTA